MTSSGIEPATFRLVATLLRAADNIVTLITCSSDITGFKPYYITALITHPFVYFILPSLRIRPKRVSFKKVKVQEIVCVSRY
jgi:hypothetical protein